MGYKGEQPDLQRDVVLQQRVAVFDLGLLLQHPDLPAAVSGRRPLSQQALQLLLDILRQTQLDALLEPGHALLEYNAMQFNENTISYAYAIHSFIHIVMYIHTYIINMLCLRHYK